LIGNKDLMLVILLKTAIVINKMIEQEQYPDRRFVIFNVTELNQIIFGQVFETSADTVRKSADLTKTFVKYDIPQPSSVAGLTTKSQEYTYDEMLAILNTPEWEVNIPTPPNGLE
jgi:hypothetical protein